MVELDIEFLKMLIISALAGGLPGVEREYGATVVAGTRTFMLFSMLGAVGVYISTEFSSFLYYLLIGAVLMVVLLGAIKNFSTTDIGLTTVTAFFLSFLLGVMVGLGYYLEAISASVIITSVLIAKKYSQMLSRALEHEEMRAAIEFGIVAFVLYPVVPLSPLDPLEIFTPKLLLRALIAITTIGFASFLALRLFSDYLKPLPKAALGSLVHYQKTVVALIGSGCSSSIALATTAMFCRNMLIVVLISLPLLEKLLIPVGAMVAGGIAFAIFSRKDAKKSEPELSIPFAVTPAAIFTAYYLAFTYIAYFLRMQPLAVFALFSFLAGIPYSAAMISSLATLVFLEKLNVEMAAVAAVLALLGSAFKAVFFSRKDAELFSRLAAFFALIALTAIAAFLVINQPVG